MRSRPLRCEVGGEDGLGSQSSRKVDIFVWVLTVTQSVKMRPGIPTKKKERTVLDRKG